MKLKVIICLSASALPLLADSRTSDYYAVSIETVDSGGGTSSSASYSQTGSAGTTGVTTGTGVTVSHSGFIGQIYNPLLLLIRSATTEVDELQEFTLTTSFQNEDGTETPFYPGLANWFTIAGSVDSIDGNGKVLAGIVGRDTPSTLFGTFAGLSANFNFTVLDALPDNYGSYAGDGLPDSWQLQHFGDNNPLAAPTADANGTGQNNRFKYIAGLNPRASRTDPFAVFRVNVQPVPGQPGSKNVVFSPRFPDRNYAVIGSPNLTTWQELVSPPTSDVAETRTVTDTSASGAKKFYEVRITKP